MTMTLKLSDEAVARLRIEAARRGVTLDDVVTQLAETLDRPSRIQNGKVAPALR